MFSKWSIEHNLEFFEINRWRILLILISYFRFQFQSVARKAIRIFLLGFFFLWVWQLNVLPFHKGKGFFNVKNILRRTVISISLHLRFCTKQRPPSLYGVIEIRRFVTIAAARIRQEEKIWVKRKYVFLLENENKLGWG